MRTKAITTNTPNGRMSLSIVLSIGRLPHRSPIKQLGQFMLDSGKSVGDTAALLGISRAYLYRLLKDEVALSEKLRVRIKEVLGAPKQ